MKTNVFPAWKGFSRSKVGAYSASIPVKSKRVALQCSDCWRTISAERFNVRGARPMTKLLKTMARYAAIREINRAAITEPSLDGVFRCTWGAVKKVIPYDRIGLSLFAPEHGALKLIAVHGPGVNSFYQAGRILDCELSHHGWVFQHQKAIVRRDLSREVEFQVEQPNVDEGIRSYCAVPLVTRHESVGVIIVLSSQKNCYSEIHADFLQEVSDHFVLALKSLMPTCVRHSHTKLLCPRCIASGGGQATSAKYKELLSEWGKQGGRGRKKLARPGHAMGDQTSGQYSS